MAQQLWIDCNADLHELLLVSKCHVTLWAARHQKVPVDQVEIVHSAKKRFVTRAKLPPGFAGDVESICAVFHRMAQQFQREQPLRR